MKRHCKKTFLIFTLCLLFGSAFSQQYNESNDFSYALKLYNEGFFDIAAQQFSLFLNRYPGSERLADARYYYGDALYKLNDVENARIEFQGLAVSFPEHSRAPQAWLMVGDCYHKLNKIEEAAKAYETVKILYPANALAPGALLKAAECYMEVRQLSRAEQITKEFLDRYVESSEYPRGRIVYGKVLLQMQELERAGQQFQKVYELTDNKAFRAEAKLGEATVYRKLGLNTRAVSALQEIIKANPGSDPAYQALAMLAQIYQESREWDTAIALLRKESAAYTAAEPKNHLKLLQAQTFFLKGDYFNARKTLQEIPSSAPGELPLKVQFYAACCDLEEKQFNAAENGFKTVLKTIEETGQGGEFQSAALYNLADLQFTLGNFQQARNYLNQFAALNPNDPGLEQLHKRLVELALRQKSLLPAVDELQRFRGAYPNSAYRDDLLYQTGRAFFREGQYDRSLPFFQQVSDEYVCSTAWDSSNAFIEFIATYYQAGQQTGVTELAKLLGKMLTGVERRSLMFELGKLYLGDLKDYEEAAKIFEHYVSESSGDSAAMGEGLYYLGESYLKLAEHRRFLRLPDENYALKAEETFKQAMSAIRYAPNPDTLTYRFLSLTAPAEATPPDKLLAFWQRFEDAYPRSALLPRVQLQLAEILAASGNPDQALIYLDRVITARKDYFAAGKAFWKKAELLAAGGNEGEAIQTLKDFLLEYTRHPYQARAYQKLAGYYAAAGDFPTAAKFLERLVDLFNYADEAEPAREQISDYYIRSGEHTKALAYLEPKINGYKSPADPVIRRYLAAPPAPFYFYAGKAYYQKKEYRSARQRLLAYLNFTRDEAYQNESLLLLGKMAQEDGEPEAALVQYALVKQDGESIFFYQANQNAADILFSQGKFAEAYQKYELAGSLAPDADQKLYLDTQKLRCLVNQGKKSLYESQLGAFKKTYEKHPQLKNSLAALEYESAKAAYNEKLFDKAINHCKTVLSKYKTSEHADDAQYLIVRSYATLNREKEALKEFEQFLKEFPGSPLLAEVYLVIAQVHFRAERSDAGLEAVRKAVETASRPETKKTALTMLISTYKGLGLWDGVLTASREYLAAYPNAGDVMDKKISIGIALSRLNRYTDAIDYLQSLKFEVSSEQEPEIQFYIGEAYFNSGQYESAINEFVKIPLLSQKTKLQWEASAFYYAGQCYERLGRKSDAIRMYQEIINRPGIEYDLKRQAQQLIDKLNSLN